jgi:hypothetical protein
MKLYRSKVPVIAKEVIETLMAKGDIEVLPESIGETEEDMASIMEDYLRRDYAFRSQVKDYMADNRTPYGDYGKVRKQLSRQSGHPLRDDVFRFLARQFVEMLMITRFVEEVFADDEVIYKRVMEILRNHDVDEREIREVAADKVKNIREGTVDYEIALRGAVLDEKKRRGLV